MKIKVDILRGHRKHLSAQQRQLYNLINSGQRKLSIYNIAFHHSHHSGHANRLKEALNTCVISTFETEHSTFETYM